MSLLHLQQLLLVPLQCLPVQVFGTVAFYVVRLAISFFFLLNHPFFLITIFFNNNIFILIADKNKITIGQYSNVQDGTIITTDDKPCANGLDGAVRIGKNVTIGHAAKLHACTINDNAVIGIGATILEGAIVEELSLIHI